MKNKTKTDSLLQWMCKPFGTKFFTKPNCKEIKKGYRECPVLCNGPKRITPIEEVKVKECKKCGKVLGKRNITGYCHGCAAEFVVMVNFSQCPAVFEYLKLSARRNHRTINQEAVFLIGSLLMNNKTG